MLDSSPSMLPGRDVGRTIASVKLKTNQVEYVYLLKKYVRASSYIRSNLIKYTHAGMVEWSNTRVCKTRGASLPRFESWSQHSIQPLCYIYLMKQKIILLALIISSFLFRWYLVSDNHFEFYYYQARDAVLSRSILENQDLKIQGPATSGTDDKIYNGVLYYYLIGPAYTLSKGNPLIPTLFLSFLSSLAVIPIFLLGKQIFKANYLAIFPALLYAFSTDSAQLGSWLSNPSLATWSVPWFYFYIHKTFYQKQSKYLPLAALMMGIATQATLYAVYLVGVILVIYILKAIKLKNCWFISKKTLFKSMLVYLISISSMIITQALLIINKIYKLSDLSLNAGGKPSLSIVINRIINIYAEKAKLVLLPSLEILSIILTGLLLIWFFTNKNYKKLRLFFSLWLFSPAILFLLLSRDSYYSITGLTPAIYLIITFLLFSLLKKLQPRFTNLVIGLFFILFLASNIIFLRTIRRTQSSSLTVQNGSFLNQLINLVDHTYLKANGESFSISTLTSPYKLNTTWAYLFNWRGMSKYGYVPKWVGSDQAGIAGDTLLVRSNQPEPIHYSIYETEPNWLSMFVPEFQKEQQGIAGPVTSKHNFGTLSLEVRNNSATFKVQP